MAVAVHLADMTEWLAEYQGPLFDAVVCDPPYHLTSIVRRFGKPGSAAAKVPSGGTGAYARASKGFMGKEWDGGDVAFRPETWALVLAKMKPGAHLVAFSGTRTYHRMACAIEDAGFEIRDQLAWAYGSGFPKSHDVRKGIDKAAGATRTEVVGTKLGRPGMAKDGSNQRNADAAFGGDVSRILSSDITAPATEAAQQWQGWGTALKPAWEPICLARKPLSEASVAANVLKHGTGAINVDGCRVGIDPAERAEVDSRSGAGFGTGATVGGNQGRAEGLFKSHDQGRWPANLCHDGSEAVVGHFPNVTSGALLPHHDAKASENGSMSGANYAGRIKSEFGGDSGSAARFFYSAKAAPLDRLGSKHATVKPVDLMRWLCRLVCPPGGLILDPFAGSGTTGIAAMAEGFDCTLIELEADHHADIERKLAYLRGEGAVTMIEHDRRREDRAAAPDMGPLFGGAGL